jgi:hypothetical protein
MMTNSKQYRRPPGRGSTALAAALLPTNWGFDVELAAHDQPKLRPGAAIAFTIAAVGSVLAFIEIVTS